MMLNKYIFTFLILFCGISGAFSQVTEQWTARYNGTGSAYDESTGIAVDPQGNVYVCGGSMAANDNQDIVTIKYSPSGSVLWTQAYDGTGHGFDDGYKVILDDQNNVYVIGTSTGAGSDQDGVLLKYNTDGVFQWGARYSNTGQGIDEFYSVAVDASHNVYVTGYSNDDFSGDDLIAIKYNSEGVMQWTKRYNGSDNNDDYGNNLVIDNSGNVYITGASTEENDLDYITIKYDAAGNEIWKSFYNGPGDSVDFPSSSAIDINSGSLYVIGLSGGVGTGSDYALVKYNLDGVQQWVQRYNGPANSIDEAYMVITDRNGNAYVTGNSRGKTTMDDYCTIKYNPAGVQQWVARYDGTGNDDYANYMAVDAAGNLYLTGLSWRDSSKEDYATIKYNPDGNEEWVKRYNGPANDYDDANCLAIDGSGNVYVTGGSDGMDQSTDYFTIKYSPVTGIQPVSGTNPDGYKLEQNYPNPFNPSTKIKFDIPASSFVSLRVYDISGKEVSTLVNGSLRSGSYEYQFDAKNLTSGIYFYKLDAGNFSEVKRMMLVK